MVVVGVLSLIGTLGGSLLGILAANKLSTYRIEQLEKKVDKHNSVVDRMYKAEDRLNVIAEQIKVANHRLEDLER